MRYLKRRLLVPEFYDANIERPRIVASHRVKRCGTCSYEVPEADITVEDGAEHCPMCRDTYTAQWHIEEEARVARIKQDSARRLNDPTQFSVRSLSESRPAAVTRITDTNGTDVTQTAPLRLVRTVATTLKLIGRYFTSSMTFTYPTGVTDSSAPVITSTLVTLSLVAAGGATTGNFDLTVNDGVSTYGHVYKKIIAIR